MFLQMKIQWAKDWAAPSEAVKLFRVEGGLNELRHLMIYVLMVSAGEVRTSCDKIVKMKTEILFSYKQVRT